MNPRFDIEAFRAIVDDRRRPRADGILERGQVEFVRVRPTDITAHVTGETGVYVVSLGEADGSDARCTCLDFAANGLGCKHVLATAMAANALTDVDARQIANRLSMLWDTFDLTGEGDPDEEVERALSDPALFAALTDEPVG